MHLHSCMPEVCLALFLKLGTAVTRHCAPDSMLLNGLACHCHPLCDYGEAMLAANHSEMEPLLLQGFELKRRGELKLIKVFQSEVHCVDTPIMLQMHAAGSP